MDLSLNPQALSQPALDFAYVEKAFDHGSIMIILTWLFKGAARSSGVPCMVIMTHTDRPDRDTGEKIVITLDDAWRWNSDLWGLTDDWTEAHVVARLRQYIDALGGNPMDQASIMKLASVIESRLSDLLNMKPVPLIKAPKLGAILSVTTATGETTEHEV